MTNRKHTDARRFGFCTRCLLPANPGKLLLEHHLYGRKNDHTAIVFICYSCNPYVENEAGPISSESRFLSLKRDLLIQSRALRWVIGNWQLIVEGFSDRNMNGVGTVIGPGPGTWQPPFGAIGHSGRNYYFIPPDQLDGFTEPPTNPSWIEDGLGGPAGGANWVRFRGSEQNILNRFLDTHLEQGSPGINLEMLRQQS